VQQAKPLHFGVNRTFVIGAKSGHGSMEHPNIYSGKAISNKHVFNCL